MISWDPDGDGPQPALIVVTGQLSVAGDVPVKNIAAWDGTRWTAVGAGFEVPPNAVGTVFRLATFRGKLVASMSDTGTTTQMFTWDGESWTPVPGLKPSRITALREFQDRLVVGTPDENYGTAETGRYLVSFDGTAWQAGYAGGLSFAPAALAVYQGRLIVSGGITAAGGVAVNSIAEWDGQAWNELETGIRLSTGTANVGALFDAGADLIVGGTFDFAGGEATKNVALWNGVFWQPMGSGLSGAVRSIVAHQDSIVVATESGVFRWTGWVWQSLGWGGGGQIGRLASVGDALYAAGSFASSAEPAVRGVAKYEAERWSALTPGLVNITQAVFVHSDGVYAGLSGSGHRQALWYWNGRIWSNPFARATEAWTRVTAIGAFNGQLVVAGEIAPNGSTSPTTLVVAAWQDGQWRRFGTPVSGFNGSVFAIAEHQGQLFVGGEFTRIDALTATSIARWDGVAWRAIGGTNGRVRALVSRENELFLAGSFSQAGTAGATNVAAWSTDGFRALGLGLNLEVRALVVSQGLLFAAGSFSRSGTVSMGGLATWTGTTWQSVPGWNFASGTLCLASSADGGLLVGGGFSRSVSDGIANNVAELRGGVWRRLAGGINGLVAGIAAWQGEWIVAGNFTLAGDRPVYAFARWTTNGVPPITEYPRSESAACGDAFELSVEVATGYTGTSFRWSRNGFPIDTSEYPSAATPSLVLGSAKAAADGTYACTVGGACGSTVIAATIISDCCPADITDDARVDDADFGLFAGEYDRLTCGDPGMRPLCPADLNRDGVVDDADFQQFANAYDSLECPS